MRRGKNRSRGLSFYRFHKNNTKRRFRVGQAVPNPCENSPRSDATQPSQSCSSTEQLWQLFYILPTWAVPISGGGGGGGGGGDDTSTGYTGFRLFGRHEMAMTF